MAGRQTISKKKKLSSCVRSSNNQEDRGPLLSAALCFLLRPWRWLFRPQLACLVEKINCTMACHREAANRSLGPSLCFRQWWSSAFWELALGLPKPNIGPWKHGVGAGVGGRGAVRSHFNLMIYPLASQHSFSDAKRTYGSKS